jgi:PKD repeat protein
MRRTVISAAVLAIAIILLAPNITITNAQQQQQPLISQPPPVQVTQNGTTTFFQSTTDGIRLNVPEGWIIDDVNNTGSMFSEESRQGYGILAQLCPQGEQQQQQQQRAALSNNISSSGGGNTVRCQESGGDIIHIVRYPDLDVRLQEVSSNITVHNNMTIDNILFYHMQKLQQVGYRNIEIVNSTDTTLNVTNAQTNQIIATVPARLVEVTYSTASAPNVIREGYFMLTATDETRPNIGMTKGYSIFYEGTSIAAGAATPATIQQTTTSTPSIRLGAPTLPPLPIAVQQVFDSFELIAAPEVAQEMLAAQSEQAQEQEVAEEEEPTSSSLTVDITSSDTEEGEEDATAPATFEFEADVSGGTEPYTYRWNFDDDGSSVESDDDETISHTFEEAGTYNVRLTVTDSSGQRASDSIRITVEEEEEPSPSPTIIEPSEREEDDISENNLPPQQEQPDSEPTTAPTEKIPAEQSTAQGSNQGGEQREATTAPDLTQSIQQNASQNTQVGIPNDNQGVEATTEAHTSSLNFDDNGSSSSEERSDEDDDDENIDQISDEAGSHNGDRTVTDREDQRASNSIGSKVGTPPEEPQEEIPAEQSTAREAKPDLLDSDNNNSGSDSDLIDVDKIFDVDGFIDNLFNKLGLDN